MNNTLSKTNFFIKRKKIFNFYKYYYSPKWIVMSTEEFIIISNEIYNNFIKLDTKNWKEFIESKNINKKILLVGKYHDIINIYRFLKSKSKKVYLCYII